MMNLVPISYLLKKDDRRKMQFPDINQEQSVMTVLNLPLGKMKWLVVQNK
ncbi:MAG: hypothetical protein ABFD00_01090 [Chloroherpetonaceae bacterium]|nr:hypothetical protein [bacterium]